MLVNFGLISKENFRRRKKDSCADSKDAEEEDVSRLVFDEVHDNTLAASALHYTPFYCSRDYVYQEMGHFLYEWNMFSSIFFGSY